MPWKQNHVLEEVEPIPQPSKVCDETLHLTQLKGKGNPSPIPYPACGDRTATTPHQELGERRKKSHCRASSQVTKGKRE